jgi:hypothetical protein
MSYLRGPLTRAQIKSLMASRSAAGATPVKAPSVAAASETPSDAAPRPVLPPDVPQYFVPARGAGPAGSNLLYQPMLLGAAQVRFVDPKLQVDLPRDLALLTALEAGAVTVEWAQSKPAGFEVDELEREPGAEALFGPLPAAAGKAKSYAGWQRDLAAWLYGSQTVELFKSPSSGEVSRPGEAERDFRVRLQQAGREDRDAKVEKLRRAYAPKIAALEDRIRRADQATQREREQASQQKVQTALSIGATLLGAFMGRKTLSSATLGRATTAARAGSRTWKETQDVARAAENVEALKQQLSEMEAQFNAEVQGLQSASDPATESFETISVKLKKTNISVRLVALCWLPYWKREQGDAAPAF